MHKTYDQRLIKSRAARGYTNHGKALYNYQEIDTYSDNLKGEEIGHLKVKKRVREVHNVIIVHDDVKSEKEKLAIGKVDMRNSRGSVNNQVVVHGDIEAESEILEIGTVRSRNQLKKVGNSVNVKGDIHAK